MDEDLVRDPGWSAEQPAGRPHFVVHQLCRRTIGTYALNARRATLVDPNFAYGADEAYFEVGRTYASALHGNQAPHNTLQELMPANGRALVTATGPSAALVTAEDARRHDLRITCNSAVRDRDFIETLDPTLIAFSDPVFHYGPSRYAAEFRRDLLRVAHEGSAMFVTSNLFVEPLLAHVPDLRTRIIVLPFLRRSGWRWPTEADAGVRITGNVLTNLMLPVAFALATNITVAGCDGRDSAERYYWRHNPSTQYEDAEMNAAFAAHIAFFRDRDYADYYENHCRDLEEYFRAAEGAGKHIEALTPSHIPALIRRGAPPFSS